MTSLFSLVPYYWISTFQKKSVYQATLLWIKDSKEKQSGKRKTITFRNFQERRNVTQPNQPKPGTAGTKILIWNTWHTAAHWNPRNRQRDPRDPECLRHPLSLVQVRHVRHGP